MSTFDDFMIDEASKLRAELAGCKQQLALVPTYEKMIAHQGAQEVRIRELEEALRKICDPNKCTLSAPAMFHIAHVALKGIKEQA